MNETETKFYEEAKKRGWKIYRNGYPDFLLVSPNNPKHVFLVEVKKRWQPLSKNQKETFQALENLGLEVVISHDGEWVDPIAKFFVNSIEGKVEQIKKLHDELGELEKETYKIMRESKAKVEHLKKCVEELPWEECYVKIQDDVEAVKNTLQTSQDILKESCVLLHQIEDHSNSLKKHPKG